jgi:peptide-methionine (S)-S-oxide reductase
MDAQQASFAAGCFWGVEQEFRRVKGIVNATVGYSGGHTKNPTYEQVCTGKTGHAETVLIEFDPALVTYDQLLDTFWDLHDPTTMNRQGPDVGEQYRSIIFYHNEEQKKIALASRNKEQKRLSRPIVTEIIPAADFWRAEEYHQRYLEQHGGAAHC